VLHVSAIRAGRVHRDVHHALRRVHVAHARREGGESRAQRVGASCSCGSLPPIVALDLY
jgi:hypothetical protein